MNPNHAHDAPDASLRVMGVWLSFYVGGMMGAGKLVKLGEERCWNLTTSFTFTNFIWFVFILCFHSAVSVRFFPCFVEHFLSFRFFFFILCLFLLLFCVSQTFSARKARELKRIETISRNIAHEAFPKRCSRLK